MYSQDYDGEYYDEYSEEYYSEEYYSDEYYGDEYYDPEYPEESASEPAAAAEPAASVADDATGFTRTVSLGLGLEFNGLYNHLDGFHAGGFIHLDFRFIRLLALGLKISYVQDILNTATLNYNVRNIPGVGLVARFYFPEVKIVDFFAQVEGGVTVGWFSGIVSYDKFGKVDLGFWVGGEAGARINVNKLFYIEPFVRGGYPFVWATGVAFGFKFEAKKPTVNIIRYPRAFGTPQTPSSDMSDPNPAAPAEDYGEYDGEYYEESEYSDDYYDDGYYDEY
ncbi:MAG: hypothetical protein Ta2A_09990 [Treponemataceae bacterium]|nr:MAG: hypothetical protein Ta2A_09990 [Treponemataceae bacterium]